ncbi:hypothetical protein [Paenibacillus sp. AD87]|uniref:hypothetical protein n=1 Tax=Paenibacillus sp. AD87 TaxID=1528787 RepID=UPI0007FCEE69|nr:hypothetical protein [Paenibacillus sp. AD87]OAX46141.1 hypothetical protein gpAD87_26965 [Paenibacillus sp. AD87]
MVKDQKNSYVLFFKGGTVYNKDTKKYNPSKDLQFRVDGFSSADPKAFSKGELNAIARLYRSSFFDVPAVIIPKKGTVQEYGNLEIRLQTPASGNLFTQIVPLSLRGTR